VSWRQLRLSSTSTHSGLLEDTMNMWSGAFGFQAVCAWELVKNLCKPIRLAFLEAGKFGVASTQPESLILAQSERWRQA
jgi:hypothetical protein